MHIIALVCAFLTRIGSASQCDFCTAEEGRYGDRKNFVPRTEGSRQGILTARDRGGFQVFQMNHPDPNSIRIAVEPPKCALFHVIMIHHFAPSEDAKRRVQEGNLDFDKMEDSWSFNLVDRTFMVNAAYSAIHDYGFTFFVPKEHGERHAMWAKVLAMKYVLKECPDTHVLALDTDAYIRVIEDPVDVPALSSMSGRTLAMALECGWFVWPDCSDMASHQHFFETDPWTEVSQIGVVNTGAVFVLNPRAAPSFLDEWYNFTSDSRWKDGPEFNKRWPADQKALRELLQWGHSNRKSEVLLLDPYKYGGPDGLRIRHSYGRNKNSIENNYDISRLLQEAHARLNGNNRRKPSPRFVTDLW